MVCMALQPVHVYSGNHAVKHAGLHEICHALFCCGSFWIRGTTYKNLTFQNSRIPAFCLESQAGGNVFMANTCYIIFPRLQFVTA